MNLHANAALSLKGRRELCLAVVEQERRRRRRPRPPASVSVALASGWVATAPRERLGCVIAPRRRHPQHSVIAPLCPTTQASLSPSERCRIVRRTSAARSGTKNSTQRPTTASRSRSSSTDAASPETKRRCPGRPRQHALGPSRRARDWNRPRSPIPRVPRGRRAVELHRQRPCRHREPSCRERCRRPPRTARCTAQISGPATVSARSPSRNDRTSTRVRPGHRKSSIAPQRRYRPNRPVANSNRVNAWGGRNQGDGAGWYVMGSGLMKPSQLPSRSLARVGGH